MPEQAAAPNDDRVQRGDRRFVVALTVVTVVALAVRIAYVLIDRANISLPGDAYFYHVGANLLAQGHGFIEPYSYRPARSSRQPNIRPSTSSTCRSRRTSG